MNVTGGHPCPLEHRARGAEDAGVEHVLQF
jgi:hypothetical protein